MIPPIFKDPKLQEEFDRNGVVEMPMLSQEEIDYMTKLFHELHPEPAEEVTKSYYSSVISPDHDYKYRIHNELKALLSPYCEKYLQNYRNLVYTMHVKGVGDYSELDVHQDWSIVDEKKYLSMTLWIPLSDTTEENGTIYALPGSHKMALPPRGGTIEPALLPFKESIKEQMKAFPVKAGTALFFAQNLVHYSPPNHTDELRLTLISAIISQPAELSLLYKKGESTLEQYKMHDEFWLNYGDFKVEKESVPNGEKIAEYQNVTLSISEDEFWKRYEEVRPMKPSFWNRFKEKVKTLIPA